MTFSSQFNQTATSSGLVTLHDASATTGGLNNSFQWAQTEEHYGTSVCSVASGVITLPVGYYYLLEGSCGIYGASNIYDLTIQFYNENTNAYVGTKGFYSGQLGNAGEHYRTFSLDDCARLWVDATSSTFNVSLKQQAASGGSVTAFDQPQPAAGSRKWVGYSRCLVWRFT